MHSVEATGRGAAQRGRPLDTSRDVAIREAALELLAEIGYDRLTIDAVAARAHASKVTIYRRWSGKAELVVDALGCRSGGEPPDVDTGSLRGDLDAIAQRSGSSDSRADGRLIIGLITALARDAELRLAFRRRLVDPRIAAMKRIFERAVARGEVAEERNLDLLVSLYPALTFHHLLLHGEMPDAGFSERVVNDVVLPLAEAPAGTGRPRRRR